ncbi:MAG: hypothetical protein KF768_04440 [Phycisphaeraceae bacterium]|nr:hypothetical protein [Phycisphaeraceae bacterium]
MNLREILARLDRAQRTRLFKIVASCVVLLGAIGAVGWYAVARAAGDQPAFRASFDQDIDLSKLSAEEREQFEATRSSAELTAKALNQIYAARMDTGTVAVGAIVVGAVLLGVVWLGVCLSALALVLLLACVGVPLLMFGSGRWADAGGFVLATGALAISFVVLMAVLRSSLWATHPVTAVARNVVIESTRMRVVVVFIVLLILALAALPGSLDTSTPLRYRVQNFLQYGSGVTFWIIAVLVLFLSVATVAFEQRDKVIWQTMTKPVTAWQYLLGKWLGVAGVAAVLLGVSASGMFLFTEYLREQPANDEIRAFVPRNRSVAVTEDREILQTQVLTARRSVRPDIPTLSREDEDKEVAFRFEQALNADRNFKPTAAEEEAYRDQIRKEFRAQFISIGPGQGREFVFRGLGVAREQGRIATLRYRIDVGANDPRTFFRITFFFRGDQDPVVQEVPLGQTMTLRVRPTAIDGSGNLEMFVFNGDYFAQTANPQSMSFPPDGLEVFYAAGSYRSNFARVMIVHWLKLAFLAMVGVTAATFLSFPVASMVAFGMFLMAESSGFLFRALETYTPETVTGGTDYFIAAVRLIAVPIAYAWGFYSTLTPTADLVDGRLLSWFSVARAAVLLGVLTGGLYVVGGMIFKRRELAMYSGQ